LSHVHIQTPICLSGKRLMAEKWTKAEQLFIRWQESMEAFVEEALGIDGTRGFTMSEQQREACREISKLVNAKTKRMYKIDLTEEETVYANKLGMSIMAGQGTGKDGWTAWFIQWFEFCFKNVLIPCTAPSADQLKNILWMEVSRWLSRVGTDGKPLVSPMVKDKIVVQSDRIFRKPAKGGDVTNFAFPKTANPKDDAEAQAKTLYGFHDIHILYLNPSKVLLQKMSTFSSSCSTRYSIPDLPLKPIRVDSPINGYSFIGILRNRNLLQNSTSSIWKTSMGVTPTLSEL
jgi:hypothetical protein